MLLRPQTNHAAWTCEKAAKGACPAKSCLSMSSGDCYGTDMTSCKAGYKLCSGDAGQALAPSPAEGEFCRGYQVAPCKDPTGSFKLICMDPKKPFKDVRSCVPNHCKCVRIDGGTTTSSTAGSYDMPPLLPAGLAT